MRASRDGAAAARKIDILEVGGSNPSPATDTGRKCAIKFDARRSKEITARVPVLVKPGTQRSESYRPCLQKYEKQIKQSERGST